MGLPHAKSAKDAKKSGLLKSNKPPTEWQVEVLIENLADHSSFAVLASFA
jgi:hypothetical protein